MEKKQFTQNNSNSDVTVPSRTRAMQERILDALDAQQRQTAQEEKNQDLEKTMPSRSRLLGELARHLGRVEETKK